MNRNYNENHNNKYNSDSKYSFEFKKCKICQCRDSDTNNYGTYKSFMINGEFHCLTCMEKGKLFNCRWCHKDINPVHAFTHGKALCVHGGGQWGNEIDVSTVCCMDCLNQINKKRGISNTGGWKECETSGCLFTLSPYEEAIGRKKCYHCWKKEYDKERVEREKAGKEYSQKYRQAHEKAQNYWNTLSSPKRERECERLVKNMKLGKYWANNIREGEASGSTYNGFYTWQIKGGKFVSDTPHKVPIQIAEEFAKKEFGETESALILRDYAVVKYDPNKSDNSSRPNPGGLAPQLINETTGDNSVNLGNSPQLNLEKDKPSEVKRSIKLISNDEKNSANPGENHSPKRDNKTLIINLKDIKQITLTTDGNLVIEFSEKLENGYSISQRQVITAEQINNNQELQIVKNYCQQNGKTSLNQQELNSIVGASPTQPANNKNNDNLLGIGLAITAALLVGLAVGLLLKRRKIKKN